MIIIFYNNVFSLMGPVEVEKLTHVRQYYAK